MGPILTICLVYFICAMISRWLNTAAEPPPKSAEILAKDASERDRLQAEYRKHKSDSELIYKSKVKQYRQYLQSKRWKKVRQKVLTESNYTCSKCGRPAKHVHHAKYSYKHWQGGIKRENYDNLQPLCAQCHMDIHGIQ